MCAVSTRRDTAVQLKKCSTCRRSSSCHSSTRQYSESIETPDGDAAPPFSSRDTLGILRQRHPEGEPCVSMYQYPGTVIEFYSELLLLFFSCRGSSLALLAAGHAKGGGTCTPRRKFGSRLVSVSTCSQRSKVAKSEIWQVIAGRRSAQSTNKAFPFCVCRGGGCFHTPRWCASWVLVPPSACAPPALLAS